jgi:hypothetical protein
MSKGDWRRPSSTPEPELAKKYEELFGKPKLNVMSDEERKEFEAEKRRLAQELEGDQ